MIGTIGSAPAHIEIGVKDFHGVTEIQNANHKAEITAVMKAEADADVTEQTAAASATFSVAAVTDN